MRSFGGLDPPNHDPAKLPPASGTKRKGASYMRCFGALVPPNLKACSR